MSPSSGPDPVPDAWRESSQKADSVDELGAELVPDLPRQPALTRTTGRQDDGEFRRDLQIFGDHLDAAGRNIGDHAVAWQRPCAQLNFGDAPARAAFALAAIHKHSDPQAFLGNFLAYRHTRERLETA
jgi:hypothetical protein